MDIKVIVTYKEDENIKKKEFNGTFDNNRIIYNDDAKTIIDLDNKLITREVNDDYKIELDFIDSICKVHIKEASDVLKLNMNVKKYEHENNKISIIYVIENDDDSIIEYNIEYKNI